MASQKSKFTTKIIVHVFEKETKNRGSKYNKITKLIRISSYTCTRKLLSNFSSEE